MVAPERDRGLHRLGTAVLDAFDRIHRLGVLHGDIHHGNILDGGPRGWLAIDPKRLVGERSFDFANIFCNPEHELATAPGRLARQATVIAVAADLERQRLLKWVLAYAGLSAAWTLGANCKPELALAVAELAATELSKATVRHGQNAWIASGGAAMNVFRCLPLRYLFRLNQERTSSMFLSAGKTE